MACSSLAAPPVSPPKSIRKPLKGAGPTSTPQDVTKAQEIYKISRAARQAEADGDWSKALELWQSVQKERPGDYSAYGGIRRSLTSLSRFDEALRFIDSSMKLSQSGTLNMDPSMIAADRIEVLFAAGRDDDATAEIDDLIDQQKGNSNIYRSLANVLYGQRRGDDAIALLKRGRTDCDDPYLFAREIAQFAEARMDWPSAVDEYLLYLEQTPENLSYVTGTLGDIMQESNGDSLVENSISNRIKSVTKIKGNLEPLIELQAGLLFRARKFKASLEAYRQLDHLQGDGGMVLYDVAQRLDDENEPQLALEAYAEFLAGNVPRDIRYRTNLKIATTCEKIGLIDSAEVSCKAVLVPGAPIDVIVEANYLLGKYALIKKQSPATAREYFEAALKLVRNIPSPAQIDVEGIEISLAITYEMESQFNLARKELEKVVRLSGLRGKAAPQARLELARLAFRQGNPIDAQNQIDALLAADPNSEVSNEALEISTLINCIKEDTTALKSLGRADFLTMIGKFDEALIALDTLASNGTNTYIVEEALWRKVDILRQQGAFILVLNNLDKIIALEGITLRRDRAIYEAGLVAQENLADPISARKYYEKLLIEFPESPLAERVRKLAKNLSTSNF